MKINMRLLAGVLCMALLLASGCGKGKTDVQAIVQVSMTSDCVSGNKLEFGTIALADSDLVKQVDDLKLAEKWSSSGKSVTREEALERLKKAVLLSPDNAGFTLRVIGSDAGECEAIANGVALSIKTKAEQTAGRQVASVIEAKQKEADAAQEKLSAARKELVGEQKGGFVPSQYRLTPEYEAATQTKIKNARAEEAERTAQLESLRKMQGAEQRAALVKIEMGRMAAASSATNLGASISTLLTANQAQKGAEKELEMAKSGAINETNAVGHAELKLEQANRNLTNTMEAYIKSLEIETDVAKARREEMEKQLEKLREASKRAGEKAGIEKQIENLNGQLNILSSEIEQWKLCQRLLPDAIQITPAQVEPVRSR